MRRKLYRVVLPPQKREALDKIRRGFLPVPARVGEPDEVRQAMVAEEECRTLLLPAISTELPLSREIVDGRGSFSKGVRQHAFIGGEPGEAGLRGK